MKIHKSRKTIIVLLVAVAALLWAIQVYRDDAETLLREAVESRGSRVLGTRVDVGDAAVDLDGGRASLAGLVVANPGGFSDRNMISVETMAVHGDFGDRVIDRVVLSGVDTIIEFRGARSNFETLGDRVASRAADDAAAAGDDDEEAGDEEDVDASGNEGTGKEAARDDWQVGSIQVENIRVRVEADWSSDVVDFDAGGLSIDSLDAGTDALARTVLIRFLDRVLMAAAEQVDDDRLREGLMEKARELRDRVSRPDDPDSG